MVSASAHVQRIIYLFDWASHSGHRLFFFSGVQVKNCFSCPTTVVAILNAVTVSLSQYNVRAFHRCNLAD